ncbi:MAG: ABC transporter permease [Phycisphaerae bacterium]|jgi:ABC-type transport system involved in multi-copper enzyme maturation permease subunit
MTKLWSIARNTFVQTIRQPMFGLIVLATFVILMLILPLSGWTMDPNAAHHDSDQRMLLAMGVSMLLWSGMLISAFSASGALSREIEDRTALTVISKPVSRATFVLGKFAGVALAVTVAYYLCTLVFLMIVRHGVVSTGSDPYDWPVIILGNSALAAVILMALAGNYLFGWTFTSTAVTAGVILLSLAGGVIGFIGKGWIMVPFGTEISPQLLIGVAITFLAVLIFTSVAVASSTRLSQIPTILICLGLLVLGYCHQFIFQREGNVALTVLGWLVPNLRLFDVQDPLIRERTIPLDYLGKAAAYAAMYSGGALALAVALFQRRSLEAASASESLPSAVSLLSWLGRAGSILLGIGTVVVVLSGPEYRTATALAWAGAALVAAVGGWVVWSCFARGLKWSYWVAQFVFILTTLGGAAAAFGMKLAQGLDLSVPTAVAVAAVSGVIVLVLSLPKTRHHFDSPASTSSIGPA